MAKRPFEGITILDFSQVLAAPFCGMLLADMGAEIIKVERLGGGDFSREYGPYINDTSLYFCQYNRGKKSIAVDMRTAEGKAVILDLVRQSDIVMENYKTGTLDKLGLGYKEMLAVNPGLIYGSISGFGLYGPLSHLPCMDIIAAARSGLIYRTGEEGGAPIKPGFSMCDPWAGLNLLRGLTMALLYKQRTGRGLRVDVAMLDCAFYMCEWPVLDHSLNGSFAPKTGNHDPLFSPSGEFPTNDGYAVVDVQNEDQWQKFCAAMGLDALAADPRFVDNAARVANRAALIAILEKETVKLGRYELQKKLHKAGVPAAAVQTLAEFAANPQTEQLGVMTKVPQPGVGEFLGIGTPMRFSKTPANPQAPAAGKPGAHSLEVLKKLGYPDSRVDGLLDGGIVQQA